MMWHASVNAICARAHGTGSTASMPPPEPSELMPPAPSRSSRWSPTRRALAMAVSAGFTAPMLGKKLVSTT